jgi:hypothetical protein
MITGLQIIYPQGYLFKNHRDAAIKTQINPNRNASVLSRRRRAKKLYTSARMPAPKI